MIVLSPSQVKTYRECVRKWALTKVAGIRTPSTKSQSLGKDVDDNQLQPYLRDGRAFDFTKVTEGFEQHPGLSAEIATTALAWIPQPKWQGVEVQKHFVFQSPSRKGFGWQGYKDVWAPYGGVPGFENEFPTVQDFKTSKSIRKWALKEDQLRTDPQSIIYAVNAILETKSKEINLSWLYLQTEGSRLAVPTLVTVHTDEVAEVFATIDKDGQEMFKLLKAAPSTGDEAAKEYALTLPPNPEACDNYGGCPFRHICNLSPEDFFASIDKPVRNFKEEAGSETMGDQIDLFSKLKKKAAGEAPAATPDPAAVEAAGMAAALATPDTIQGIDLVITLPSTTAEPMPPEQVPAATLMPTLNINPPMPEGTPLAPPVGSTEAKRKPGRPKKAAAAVQEAGAAPVEVTLPVLTTTFELKHPDAPPTPPADYVRMAKAFKAAAEAFLAVMGGE